VYKAFCANGVEMQASGCSKGWTGIDGDCFRIFRNPWSEDDVNQIKLTGTKYLNHTEAVDICRRNNAFLSVNNASNLTNILSLDNWRMEKLPMLHTEEGLQKDIATAWVGRNPRSGVTRGVLSVFGKYMEAPASYRTIAICKREAVAIEIRKQVLGAEGYRRRQSKC